MLYGPVFFSVTVAMMARSLTPKVDTIETFMLPAVPNQTAPSILVVEMSHAPVVTADGYTDVVRPLFT